MNDPDVSLVVIGYNEEERLPECLTALFAQDFTGTYEVIFVDDGSCDDTLAIAERIAADEPRLRVVALGANHGRGVARRRGVAAARGRYVGYVDSDITVPADWIRRCVGRLDAGVDATGGVACPDGDCAVVHRMFGAAPKPIGATMVVAGANALLTREALLGAPVVETPLGEDFRMFARMLDDGYRVECIPDLLVEHRETRSYAKALRWLYDSGVDATRLLVELRRVRVPDLAWVGWSLVMLGALLAAWRWPLLWVTPVLATVVIGAAHAMSRFSAANGWGRLCKTIGANIPLIGAYLVGRSVGVFVVLAERRR